MLPQPTEVKDAAELSSLSPGQAGGLGEPGGCLCMPRGSHVLSSLCCWGQEWQSPSGKISKANAPLFF